MSVDGTAPSAGETPTGSTQGDPSEIERSAEAKVPKVVEQPRVRIGVIADAHGYLDPRVTRIFAGVDHIVVAGDVVDPEILTTLSEVAPVTAVRGASDGDALAAGLPQETTGEVGGVRFAVGHSSKRLLKRLSNGSISVGSKDALPDLVVWAGTHKPSVAWIDGTLFLDPGTAGSPEREDNDPTVAIVERGAAGLAVRFVPLRRRPAQEPRMQRVLGFRGGLVPTMMEREVKTPRGKRLER
jgi:uncharacterized protein